MIFYIDIWTNKILDRGNYFNYHWENMWCYLKETLYHSGCNFEASVVLSLMDWCQGQDVWIFLLIHCGRVTHINVIKLTSTGSDNGFVPGQCQAIFWTNAAILLIRHMGTNLSEILIKKLHIFIHEIAFENVISEMSAILSQLQCLKELCTNPLLWSYTDLKTL